MNFPSFIRSAATYTAANFLNAIIPVLLLPILTSHLSKEDYGMVSLFQVMIMIVLPLSGVNAQSAVEREFFEHKFEFSRYVTNSLYTLLLFGGSILVLFLLFNKLLSDLTQFPGGYLWLIACYCIAHNVCEVMLAVWRVNNNATSYGLFRIGRTIVEILLSILMVVTLQLGWQGRTNAMVIAAVLFAVISIFFFHRRKIIQHGFRLEQIKNILKFGLPLIPHTLGGVTLIYSDRLFITNMVGLAETGSYTVGYQVAMVISLLQASFNLAWVPWFYGKLNLNDAGVRNTIVKITYVYNVVILLIAFVLTIVSPLIFNVFIHKNYHDSIQFVFWIALGFAFDGMYKMVVNYIFYIKKTYIISIVTLGVAVLNLVLNYFLIKMYGPVGAAKATALCMALEFVVVWYISNRLYPMPWFSVRGIFNRK